MPICPLHRAVYNEPWECATCEKEGLVALSVEYDKQDRVRDTMTYMGHEFDPTRSRAVMVFNKPKEKSDG